MKALFVCSSNLGRSPTAETLFKSQKGWETKSAGVLEESRARITKELIAWADKIYVMETWHKEAIVEKWPEAKDKIIMLGIPDIYAKDDPELIKALKEKMRQYL